MLCQFQHVAGPPREGFHAARIPVVDLELWDVVGTVCIALVLAGWFRSNVGWTLLLTFAVAVLVHWMFCVETTITRNLLPG